MPSWLHVKPDGTIGLDERARARLVGNPGPVVLVGDLSRFGFTDLLSAIVQARMSGILRVTTGSSERSLVFDDGELRGTSSSRVGERLGEVAVRMGLLKSHVMDELQAQTLPGQRFGRAAVDGGELSEHDLWNVMQEQVTSIFQAIMLEEEGIFTFAEGSVDEHVTVPGLSVEMLLIEGLRRIDEMKASPPGCAREKLASILASYNAAYRDIFAAASEAGFVEVLRRESSSAFAGDAFQAFVLNDIAFGDDGGICPESLLERFEEVARGVEEDPEVLLREILSKAVLFLLFVTGERLDPDVQRALHARVKARVAPPG